MPDQPLTRPQLDGPSLPFSNPETLATSGYGGANQDVLTGGLPSSPSVLPVAAPSGPSFYVVDAFGRPQFVDSYTNRVNLSGQTLVLNDPNAYLVPGLSTAEKAPDPEDKSDIYRGEDNII